MIGVFELISGFIATLAILIGLSDRIIKNYTDTVEQLDDMATSIMEVEEKTLHEYDVNSRPHDLIDDISKLQRTLEYYKTYNIIFSIGGLIALILYGTILLSNLQYYNVFLTTGILLGALSPTLGYTLYCHIRIFRTRSKWYNFYR